MVTSLKHLVHFIRSYSASVVLEKLKLNLMQSQSLTMIRLHQLTKVHLFQKMENLSLVYLQKLCLVVKNKYFMQKFYRHYSCYNYQITIIHFPVEKIIMRGLTICFLALELLSAIVRVKQRLDIRFSMTQLHMPSKC